VNFLNIGPWEMLAILALAVLLVGPKRMASLGRSLGRISGQMRRMSSEFLGTLRDELEETEQEARQAIDSTTETGAELAQEIQATTSEAGEALEGTKDGGPTTKESVTSIQDELKAFGQETKQMMQDIVGGVEETIGSKQKTEEAADEEASDEA